MPTKEPRFAWKRVTKSNESCYITDPDYCLHYPKGAKVMAPKGSYGISVFDTWLSAQHFSLGNKIKKVRIIGRIRKIPLIRADNPDRLNIFYKTFKGYKNLRRAGLHWARLHYWDHFPDYISNNFPEGTFWVDGVKVLT